MSKEIKIEFNNTDESYWRHEICTYYEQLSKNGNGTKVTFFFANSINVENILPFHLVTLANLIHYLSTNGYLTCINKDQNLPVYEYIYKDLNFSEYWLGGKNHVEAKTSKDIFNLWRIVENEMDLYAKKVEDYFRNTYFKKKDLSFISTIMTEAFYNVFDHAKAGNNAFSIIKYIEEDNKLHVAISDFGIGITKSVRSFLPSIKNDKEALKIAVKDKFTVGSTLRNRGFGLANILNGADTARIFSGMASLLKEENTGIQFYDTDINYPGTLIYFEVDLSKSEDEVIIEEFDW